MSLLLNIWEYCGIAQESQRFSSSSVNCKQLRCCLYIIWFKCRQCMVQRILWICIKFTACLLLFLKLFKTLEEIFGGGKTPLK